MGYSIWLDFCEDSERVLKQKINELAAKFSCPEFHPHLTLAGDLEIEIDRVRELARHFSEVPSPLDVVVRDVGSSDNYFMALYLSVNIPDALNIGREAILSTMTGKECNLDAPHISLAYGNFEAAELHDEKDALLDLFHDTTFHAEGISLVRSSKRIPIECWEKVETIKF